MMQEVEEREERALQCMEIVLHEVLNEVLH